MVWVTMIRSAMANFRSRSLLGAAGVCTVAIFSTGRHLPKHTLLLCLGCFLGVEVCSSLILATGQGQCDHQRFVVGEIH